MDEWTPKSANIVEKKGSPFETIQHIAQGRHICKDEVFKQKFKEEFLIAQTCKPEAVT